MRHNAQAALLYGGPTAAACDSIVSSVLLRRMPWNWYHRCVGYSLLLLGLANAYIGFNVGAVGWGWYLGLALAWGAIAFAAGAKLLYDMFSRPGAKFIMTRGKHKRTDPPAQIA